MLNYCLPLPSQSPHYNPPVSQLKKDQRQRPLWAQDVVKQHKKSLVSSQYFMQKLAKESQYYHRMFQCEGPGDVCQCTGTVGIAQRQFFFSLFLVISPYKNSEIMPPPKVAIPYLQSACTAGCGHWVRVECVCPHVCMVHVPLSQCLIQPNHSCHDLQLNSMQFARRARRITHPQVTMVNPWKGSGVRGQVNPDQTFSSSFMSSLAMIAHTLGNILHELASRF